MNKKLKIVSSIALAGMIVTSSFGVNKVFANSTSEYITNPIGIYNKLVEGKSVVPFVLASKDDSLTVKDVTQNDLFKGKVSKINGTAIADQNELVGTGDIITTTDGKEYTIVVYGDVDGNGKINALDALQVEKNNVNIITLSDEQKEAADVKNDDNLNSIDSLSIKKYVVGLQESIIDKLPEAEEVVMDSNYTFSIKESQYVNSVNEGNIIFKIDIKDVLDTDTTFKLVISDEDRKTEDTEKTVTIGKNLVSTETEDIDLSNLSDGKLTVTMKDQKENVVAQYTMVKNTVIPLATNVNTNRTGTRTATISLEKCGESGISKVKYVVKGLNDQKPESVELTNTINANNGKIENVQVADNLDTKTAYKLYYILENEYGSVSEMKEVIISSDDNNVKAEEALKEVVAPVLAETDEGVFTWNEDSSKTYVATLYKDGEAKDVKEVTGLGKIDFTTQMKENGTYKVSVIVKGNDQGTSTNSPATESKEVTVSTLEAVSDVKIENVENVIELSWNNPNKKEEFKKYSISLYSINDKGEEVLAADDITCDNDKNKIDITSKINVNTIYVAKVNVIALDGQMEKLTPEEVTSNQFYLVAAPTMDGAVRGTESITFGITPINIPNKTVEYKVEVYDVDTTWNDDYDRAKYTLKTTKNVIVDNENKITIDGLNSLDTYTFKLIAVVDGNEVKSSYSDEIQTLPEINNLTYASNKDEAMAENSFKVFVDGNMIYVNGNEFDTSVIKELQPVKAVLDNLFEGDIVTINEDASSVEIKLGGTADVTERSFTGLDESSVVLENNNYNKTISGAFKTLTLKGIDTLYDVSGVTADEIILTDGVEVKGDKTYTVESSAEVTINKVRVTTGSEMKLSASDKDLGVTVSGGSSNNVVFENSTEGDATISFVGDDTFTAEQSGTITIKSIGGKVTIKSSQVNVSADIKVEVNNGKVDITEPALTGDKDVSVSTDEGKESVIEAISKIDAPEQLIGKTFELKAYSDKEITEEFGVTNQDEKIAIVEYINSFGLNGKGATITVGSENKVTITLTGSVDKIDNLK